MCPSLILIFHLDIFDVNVNIHRRKLIKQAEDIENTTVGASIY